MALSISAFFWALLCLYRAQLVVSSGNFAALAAEVGRQNNQTLFWGPYKPNLYFGVRPRSPHGLWTGLMWTKLNNLEDPNDGFRYTCEQHQGILGYGWEEFDARTGGVQTIHDIVNGMDLTTSFIKIPSGDRGGSWAARIKGVPRPESPADLILQLHYFIAQDGPDSQLVVDTTTPGASQSGFAGDVQLQGSSPALGEYKIAITKGQGQHPSSTHAISNRRPGDQILVQSLDVPEDLHWQAKSLVFQQMAKSGQYVEKNWEAADYPPAWQTYAIENQPGPGNVHIVQRVFEGPFEFDVIFSSMSSGQELTSVDVSRAFHEAADTFAGQFESIFSPQIPYNDAQHVRFGKTMFSNLIGGLGYFYGDHIVDRSEATEYDEQDEGFWEQTAEARARGQNRQEGPHELFTSIPSRPFFPRGFLWDEGFHLLPIVDWDLDLALDITSSWLNLMDEDGWIAREQILGPEARSKVPEEFQVQYPHYANPPTLFLVINAVVTRLRSPGKPNVNNLDVRTAHADYPQLGRDYLKRLFPRLRQYHAWIRRTQSGDLKSYDRTAYSRREAYRWRGRTERHLLTSGLDDYPRALPPHPGELHVDLMSWMGFMANSLANVAKFLDMHEEAAEYSEQLYDIQRNLDDLHWSEQEGCYCDASVDEYEDHSLVCHKGYIAIFPFLLGLLPPDHPHLEAILNLLGDEQLLFSPHGLRSLSKTDPLYGTGENYWRGPVWININYLAIVQLHSLSTQHGLLQARALRLYTDLRRNVVDTIYDSWAKTGFAWEQYDPETGRGQRTQHFTGWTSLVVKIMAMPDGADTASSLPEKDEL